MIGGWLLTGGCWRQESLMARLVLEQVLDETVRLPETRGSLR